MSCATSRTSHCGSSSPSPSGSPATPARASTGAAKSSSWKKERSAPLRCGSGIYCPDYALRRCREPPLARPLLFFCERPRADVCEDDLREDDLREDERLLLVRAVAFVRLRRVLRRDPLLARPPDFFRCAPRARPVAFARRLRPLLFVPA